jgi:hypothetical protein
MTGRDPQEGERRALGFPSSLLPVSQRVHADPEGGCEPFLREPDELAQRGDVLARLDLAAHDSAPLACLHRTPEVGVGQLGGFILAHDGSSM